MFLITTILLFTTLAILFTVDGVVVIPLKKFPRQVSTLNLQTLQPLVSTKPSYIRDNAFFRPYNSEILSLIEKNLKNPNITAPQMVIQSLFLLPNSGVGMASVTPTTNPADTFNFQYGTGLTGWYFHYGMSSDSADSYFIYLSRLEVLPAELQIQKGLELGASAYYSIGAGIGIGGKWYNLPFTIVSGKYSELSEQTFIFEANEMHCVVKGSSFNLEIEFSFTDVNGVTCSCTAAAGAGRKAYFNGVNGCAPCIGGAGTMYWSIPYMNTNFTLKAQDTQITKSGPGWLDRQILSTNVVSNWVNILSNIASTLRTQTRGLGKYVWLNLLVSPTLQYMVTLIPVDSLELNKEYDCTCNKYGEDGTVERGILGSVAVLKTKNIGGTEFPTLFRIHVDSKLFLLDGSFFGDSYTIDATNNVHWTGSALLYNSNNEQIGTGFIEANQLQTTELYTKNLLAAGGIDPSNINLFLPKKRPLGQTWTSFAILIAALLLIIMFFVYMIKLLT